MWSELIKVGLLKLNFTQSKDDICLHFNNNVICGIYVDDTICWSHDDFKINETIVEIKDLNFDLTYEGVVESFLGIKIDTIEDSTIAMTQTALTRTIIYTLDLENDIKQHQNPAVSPHLQKYA